MRTNRQSFGIAVLTALVWLCCWTTFPIHAAVGPGSSGQNLLLRSGDASDNPPPSLPKVQPTPSSSLAPIIAPVTGHVVRMAYIVPSNRTPQTNAVASLRNALLTYQNWYAEQMIRNGFGLKTFRFETEPDGTTPRVYVVNVSETDDYLRGDLWSRTISAATAAGVPVWTTKQVWWLIPEAHIEAADGNITGGTALGASFGSGDDAGVSMNGSDALVRLWPSYWTNNTAYHGQVVPVLGPYPLAQDVSFPWFELTTFSSISSSSVGAGLHEMSHGFGLPHDFRNDQNFKGNLMGNGLRGMRGSLYPDLYPADFVRASYGSALALNVSRYFNTNINYTDNTKPTLTISTTGTNTPVNGMMQISFTASDAGGLYAAWLQQDGDLVGEMSLSGTTTNATFATPYWNPGLTNKYSVSVFDLQGNRRSVDTSIVPRTGFNQAPRPFITFSTQRPVVGQDVVFSAANSTDPDGSATQMTVEWDLNNDGVYDTAPTTTKTFTNRFTSRVVQLIRARLTDAAGAQSVSTPVGIQVYWPTINISRLPNGVQLSWTTNANGLALYETTNLSTFPAPVWRTATQTVTISAGKKQITVTNGLPRQFFRLQP